MTRLRRRSGLGHYLDRDLRHFLSRERDRRRRADWSALRRAVGRPGTRRGEAIGRAPGRGRDRVYRAGGLALDITCGIVAARQRHSHGEPRARPARADEHGRVDYPAVAGAICRETEPRVAGPARVDHRDVRRSDRGGVHVDDDFSRPGQRARRSSCSSSPSASRGRGNCLACAAAACSISWCPARTLRGERVIAPPSRTAGSQAATEPRRGSASSL
jgi:hypothetical protein